MELTFSSIEEVKEFVKSLKGTRGGKDKDDEAAPGNAPQPMAPPTGQASAFPGAGGFAPQAGGAGGQTAFPAHGAATLDPVITELVGKVLGRIDGAIQSGQSAESCRQWVAGQIASAGHPDAMNATLDQIKALYLPKMAAPWLSQIYALMGGK